MSFAVGSGVAVAGFDGSIGGDGVGRAAATASTVAGAVVAGVTLVSGGGGGADGLTGRGTSEELGFGKLAVNGAAFSTREGDCSGARGIDSTGRGNGGGALTAAGTRSGNSLAAVGSTGLANVASASFSTSGCGSGADPGVISGAWAGSISAGARSNKKILVETAAKRAGTAIASAVNASFGYHLAERGVVFRLTARRRAGWATEDASRRLLTSARSDDNERVRPSTFGASDAGTELSSANKLSAFRASSSLKTVTSGRSIGACGESIGRRGGSRRRPGAAFDADD